MNFRIKTVENALGARKNKKRIKSVDNTCALCYTISVKKGRGAPVYQYRT